MGSAARYVAKAKGAGRVESFEDQMRSSLLRSLTLRTGFNDSLRRGEFYVQYQPHVSLQSDQLEGFEALVRWRHATHGEVGPTEFIPLAEQAGFIIPFGRWVLETACNAAATWPHPPGRLLTVAVNISALQLQNPQIIGDAELPAAIPHRHSSRASSARSRVRRGDEGLSSGARFRAGVCVRVS